MRLDINTKSVIQFSAKLQQINRSALPVSVRGALNDAVYDVKTKTMPLTSKVFVNRSANFFKANSRFEKATGFNINNMKSTVGFVSDNLKGKSNYAVKDLEEQEHGGVIKKRSFIPMKQARRGNSNEGLVRQNTRLASVRNIVDVKKFKGSNKSKFVQASHKAGKGGFVLSNDTLFSITSIKGTGGTNFKAKPIYDYKKNRNVTVKKTAFMKKASMITSEKLESFFIAQAKRRIK